MASARAWQWGTAADGTADARAQIDATFVADASKLLSGTLMALAAMMHIEVPHINVRGRMRHRVARPAAAAMYHVVWVGGRYCRSAIWWIRPC